MTRARISLLVMGTTGPSPPRWNSSSGRPGAQGRACGFSMSTALRGSKSIPASSAAVPVVTRSWGYPSRSPTLTRTCPMPAWVRLPHSPDALAPPPTSTNRRRKRPASGTTSPSLPWRLRQVTSS